MPKTIEEYRAMAMLLGESWVYDYALHAFEDGGMNLYLDADTMKVIYDDRHLERTGEPPPGFLPFIKTRAEEIKETNRRPKWPTP